MFMELHREEKSEEGDTGDQEDKGGNQKERDRSSQSGTHKEFSIVQYTQSLVLFVTSVSHNASHITSATIIIVE